MKRYILAGALALTFGSGYAQDVNKLIDEKDVDRIIKTLASDEMEGRATFTKGIDKAATFIEGEFKAAGLQPLKGETGFRQNIPPMVKTRVVGAKLTINGVTVPADKFYASSGASFSWADMTGVEIVKQTTARGIRMGGRGGANGAAAPRKLLILLDSAAVQMFPAAKARAAGGSVSAKPSPDQIVTVVGSYGDIKSISLTAEVKTEAAPLFNVAGMIPGKSKADEFVVFSGHYDHLGIQKPAAGSQDSIFNGADDDASGTTAMISLAKYFNKVKNNERTLIFVAFCAEEIGGYGARHFTTTVNPDKVAAMFNIEMIGKDSKFGPNTAFITGYERSDFGPILQKNLEGTAFKFHPDPYIKENLFYRSDNATLAALGVPAHTISTDMIDVDPHYHHASDDYSTLNVKNIISTIRAIALASRTIVSGKDTPTRIPKLER
ncbi:M20/M25/M40 family metallo-hydrolase [Mucilaginibacter myungsuensis]|uniref:M20/M25/M40 family metallo-hydrolase n=1 Tax=Mucilaginibacter myungsuensis TaxID=649104 RepID=A0A929KT91_9SPHI|nr:M20/M25/M40 family metallo-hydrolase [Mucilaginibacter myungsuensis]MBE9661134.1 M20/M25/M40 family metallo-hydrolase [Mucilaginibacter myungsuensis]MDN3597279.1 M20/M25/M40 family metallo-hydrolase [Mucilaginibacter myungsuensis]